MSVNKAISQSDTIGAIASGFCIVHCMATPLLFVAQSCSTSGCCSSGPGWWSFLDYLFIIITFFAVFYSTRSKGQRWIKYALYLSWGLLSLLVINEKLAILPLGEPLKYGVAISLIGLHLYNQKYCSCTDNSGCVDQSTTQNFSL